MKRLIHILWLKFHVKSLKSRRAKTILEFSRRNPKRASRVDNLEDLIPVYLKEIDMEIIYRERLIKTIYNNHKEKSKSI